MNEFNGKLDAWLEHDPRGDLEAAAEWARDEYEKRGDVLENFIEWLGNTIEGDVTLDRETGRLRPKLGCPILGGALNDMLDAYRESRAYHDELDDLIEDADERP